MNRYPNLYLNFAALDNDEAISLYQPSSYPHVKIEEIQLQINRLNEQLYGLKKNMEKDRTYSNHTSQRQSFTNIKHCIPRNDKKL
jgi:hypothetical protein